ncbi:MAG TPA: hypothetical protein VJW77_12195 [Terriglobia bacterium]|nr:hypothetical protein [Terriglobia bacterium]
MAKNLASRTIALLSARRQGLPTTLAYGCGRVGESQRSSGHDMVVHHQDHQ